MDDPTPFQRHSIRFKEYDYLSPGTYFITVVTYQRECLFGEVVVGKMQLNIFGPVANDEWFHTSKLRPSVQVYPEEFVVMPNHIHGVIWIDDMDPDDCRGAASLHPYGQPNEQSAIRHANVTQNSLGAIIRAYKSAVTYQINSSRNSRGFPVWQRNYYEHIVRNPVELEDISKYILANPNQWSTDPEYIH